MNPNRNVRNLRWRESGDQEMPKVVKSDTFGSGFDGLTWYWQVTRGFLGDWEMFKIGEIDVRGYPDFRLEGMTFGRSLPRSSSLVDDDAG